MHSSSFTGRGLTASRPTREQEIAAWRRNEVLNRRKRQLVVWCKRHPWITSTVGLWLAAALTGFGWLAVVALATGAIGLARQRRLRQRSAQWHAARVKAIGGEENHALAVQIWKSWPDSAVATRLARKKAGIGGIGVDAAASQAASKNYQLSRQAYGSWSDWSVPNIRAIVQHPLGVAVEVQMLEGQDIDAYARETSALAHSWRVREVRAEVAEPGVTRLIAVTADPLGTTREIAMGTVPYATTKGVVTGRTEYGDDLFFPIDEISSVVAAVPGAGKSVTLNVVVAGLAFLQDVQIVAIDCKQGVEFYDWQPRLSAFGTDQKSALDILKTVDAIGQERLRRLRGSGYKSVSRRGYSARDPLLVVVIDECAELFDAGASTEDRKRAQELVNLASRGVRLYRAAGIVYILCTQKPTSDVLPTIIRDNCGNRQAGRCMTREQETAILGPAPDDPSTPTAVAIPQSHRGMVVASDDAGNRVYGRVDFISEATSKAIAQASARLRTPLAALSADMEVIDDVDFSKN